MNCQAALVVIRSDRLWAIVAVGEVRMSVRRWSCVLTLGTLVAIAGCKDDGGGKAASPDCEAGRCADGGSTGSDAASTAGAILKGRVFDAETGAALAKTKVETSAGGSATSDAKGSFEIAADKKGGELSVSHKAYAPTRKDAPAGGGYVEVFIKDVDKRVEFRGDKGVNVELDTGERVEIPANAVIDDKGKKVAGPVTLEVSVVDGRKTTQAAALPGDGAATRKDKTKGRVAIESGLSIRIVDKDEAELNVDKGSDVVAVVPVRRDTSDKQIGVYSYDEESGRWVEEGAAKVETTQGKRAYRAQIEHLSWWSFGNFFDQVGCVDVCVEDGDENPLAGAQIWAVGATYPGVITFYSGADGCGSAETIAESEIVLVGQTFGLYSEPTKIIASFDTKTCADAGKLTLGEKSNPDCPAGFTKCGDVCVDPTSDVDHCGACDNACGGLSGRETSCIAGACGCGKGDDVCVDLAADAVQGKVIDDFGNPVSGVSVEVGGKAATTNKAGVFNAEGVKFPYDLIVYGPLDPLASDYVYHDVYIFLGVERQDPWVQVYAPSPFSASLTGTVLIGGSPAPAAVQPVIDSISALSNVQGYFYGTSPMFMSSGDVQWSGADTIDSTLFAVRGNTSTGEVTHIGSLDLTFEDGIVIDSTKASIELLAVGDTRTITGNITGLGADSSATVRTYVGNFAFSNNVAASDPTFSFDVPADVPAGAQLAMQASEYTPTGSRSTQVGLRSPSITSYEVLMRAMPEVTGPVQMVTAISNQTPALDIAQNEVFEMSRPKATMARHSLSWSQTVDQAMHSYSIYLHTDSSELPLDAITRLDDPPPAATTVNWTPRAEGTFSTVDDCLDPARPLDVVDSSSSQAQTRYFQLAPP